MSLYYKLSIVKVEENPRKGQPIPGSSYRNEMLEPDVVETRMIEAAIREDELDCIKQALLKVWK